MQPRSRQPGHSPLRSACHIALAAALFVATSAHAVVISNKKFEQSGGNPQDIRGTIIKANEPRVLYSNSSQFQSVGHIPSCTATWLGEAQGYTYVLTAAHCLRADKAGAVQPLKKYYYYSWDRKLIASGDGWQFLHPHRMSPLTGMGGSSNDIAILKLPRVATPLDADGKPVQAPVLYDGDDELARTVDYVGTGHWGVGALEGRAASPMGGRMWGQSMIDALPDGGYGMSAGYHEQDGRHWARLASGDSGSAWWQQHHGEWRIVGTSSAVGEEVSYGTRVSRYAAWIKSIVPVALLHSERMSLSESKPFISRNFAADLGTGTVYYVVPQQGQASGPAAPLLASPGGYSPIRVKVRDLVTGASAYVNLRAQRNEGCRKARMEERPICGGLKQGALTVSFQAADNPTLLAGHYRGRFDLDVRGWQDVQYRDRLSINVDLHHLSQGQITGEAAYLSPNFASLAKQGDVSYVVAPQAGGSGPSSRIYKAAAGDLSRIRIRAVDALTLESRIIVLRAARQSGCGWVQMNDAQACSRSPRQGPLLVWFEGRDNVGLPLSIYRGSVYVRAMGWQDSSVNELIELKLDLDLIR